MKNRNQKDEERKPNETGNVHAIASVLPFTISAANCELLTGRPWTATLAWAKRKGLPIVSTRPPAILARPLLKLLEEEAQAGELESVNEETSTSSADDVLAAVGLRRMGGAK